MSVLIVPQIVAEVLLVKFFQHNLQFHFQTATQDQTFQGITMLEDSLGTYLFQTLHLTFQLVIPQIM